MEIGTNESAIAVVHLVWLPYGIDLFKTFIDSYKKYPAGYPHTLVLLFNGVQEQAQTISYEQYAREQNILFECYYKKDGQDIEAYFWAAQQLSSKYLLFFNSYSEILTTDWLTKYTKAVNSSEDIGIAGATASNASPYDMILSKNTWTYEVDKTFRHNFRKYKLLVKAILLYRVYFNKFPNPHIRTNAFIINRALFLTLKRRKPKKKMDAYRFESGKNSMTCQLKKLHLESIVIDREGRKYGESVWRESHTFWIGDQENLLVADNQTQKYAAASSEERGKMIKMAWGAD